MSTARYRRAAEKYRRNHIEPDFVDVEVDLPRHLTRRLVMLAAWFHTTPEAILADVLAFQGMPVEVLGLTEAR